MQTSLSLAAAVKKLQHEWVSGSSVFPVLWSHVNVSKLPIWEEGKQRSPLGAEVDFPSFSSGATFSAGLWYIQEPGSGLTGGASEMLPLCTFVVLLLCQQWVLWSLWGPAGHFGTLPYPTMAGYPWRAKHGKRAMCPSPGSKRQRDMNGKGLVLAWRGCSRQIFWASFFIPFCFPPKSVAFTVLRSTPTAVWFFREGSTVLCTSIQQGSWGRPVAGQAGHSKWVSFIPSGFCASHLQQEQQELV